MLEQKSKFMHDGSNGDQCTFYIIIGIISLNSLQVAFKLKITPYPLSDVVIENKATVMQYCFTVGYVHILLTVS